jgi:hypothetical protein
MADTVTEAGTLERQLEEMLSIERFPPPADFSSHALVYNCLDRHVEAGRGGKVALHWRGEEGEERPARRTTSSSAASAPSPCGSEWSSPKRRH